MTEFFQGILARLQSSFDPALMGDGLARFLSSVAVGVATFAAFYLLWRILDRIARAIMRRSKVDATSASFIQTLLKFGVLTLGVVQALSAAGINTAAVVASLGLAGLTIGFAARDALSNLISGILIFWDRPFVIGDLVEVEGRYGTVERITLRSTRVVTPDGKMLAVPNSTIINSTVTSYTNFPHLRLEIPVSVSVSVDLDQARDILLALVRDQPGYLTDPEPNVVTTTLGDYFVELQLQVWIGDEREHVALRHDLREKVYKAFVRDGIDMPFETLELRPVQLAQTGS